MSTMLRHRSVFVDTAPRPANQPPTLPRTSESTSSWGPVLSAVFAILSAALMAGGVALASINSTSHLHQAMAKDFRQYVLEWDTKYLPEVQAMQMTLSLNDTLALPLGLSTRPTKPVLSQQQLVEPGSKPAQTPKFRSAHVEFKASGVLSDVLPSDGSSTQPLLLHPAAAGDRNSGSKGTAVASSSTGSRTAKAQRHVTLDMLYPTRFTLLVQPSGQTGEHAASTIDLGSHAFVRILNVTARGRGDCVHHQWGAWDAPAKECTVVEYLAELCFKLQGDPGQALQYRLDYGHGGTGCDPKKGWQPETWRRTRAQAVQQGKGVDGSAISLAPSWEFVLPKEAGGTAPTVVVRHAQDPELEGRHLLHYMMRASQPTFVGHGIGLAMVFVGLVSLVTLTCMSVPALKALWQSRGDADDD